MVEDEADRVMPSRTAVLAAARYDLHHAIQYCGGYGAVRVPNNDCTSYMDTAFSG